MPSHKARAGDEQLIYDDSADWVDRTSALSRLVADGRFELEPLVCQWLNDQDPYLRSKALSLLLIYWRNSKSIDQYIETGISYLHHEDSPEIRSIVAGALSSYMVAKQGQDSRIMRELVVCSKHDPDESVRRRCAEELSRHLPSQ